MKRLIRRIYGTTTPAMTKGTMFYRLDLKDIIKYFSKSSENCWLWILFKEQGFDAIDFENNLFGSFTDDDEIYVCVTDNKPIWIRGKSISPEYASENYDIDDLSKYIVEGTDYIIHRYLTEHEVYEPDYTLYYDALIDTGYSEEKIEKDALKFPDSAFAEIEISPD